MRWGKKRCYVAKKVDDDMRRHEMYYCVSCICIALHVVYIPGVSSNHSKSEECTKATPPAYWYEQT